jgi:hypothetical protein
MENGEVLADTSATPVLSSVACTEVPPEPVEGLVEVKGSVQVLAKETRLLRLGLS